MSPLLPRLFRSHLYLCVTGRQTTHVQQRETGCARKTTNSFIKIASVSRQALLLLNARINGRYDAYLLDSTCYKFISGGVPTLHACESLLQYDGTEDHVVLVTFKADHQMYILIEHQILFSLTARICDSHSTYELRCFRLGFGVI